MIKRAESEIEKPGPPGGHEAVKKEMTSRQEMLNELKVMRTEMMRLLSLRQSVGSVLDESANQSMQKDCESIDAAIAKLTCEVETKIERLQESDQHWSDAYSRLDSLTNWVKLEDEEIENLGSGGSDPEEKFKQAKVMRMF